MLKLPSPPLWSLPVSTAVGSRIYTLQTSGPTPPGVSYVYTLDPMDPSTDYFSLDNQTGIVTLKKPLDMQVKYLSPQTVRFIINIHMSSF